MVWRFHIWAEGIHRWVLEQPYPLMIPPSWGHGPAIFPSPPPGRDARGRWGSFGGSGWSGVAHLCGWLPQILPTGGTAEPELRSFFYFWTVKLEDKFGSRCNILSPYFFETYLFQQYLSNSNPINVPKQLSLCPCQVNKWKWFPKQRRWLNLPSEASRLCLLFSWGLSQTGATSSAKNTHFQAKWCKFWRLRLTGKWWKLKRFWKRVLVPIIARIFQPVTVPCHPAIESEGSGWLFLESLLSRTVPNSSASAGAQRPNGWDICWDQPSKIGIIGFITWFLLDCAVWRYIGNLHESTFWPCLNACESFWLSSLRKGLLGGRSMPIESGTVWYGSFEHFTLQQFHRRWSPRKFTIFKVMIYDCIYLKKWNSSGMKIENLSKRRWLYYIVLYCDWSLREYKLHVETMRHTWSVVES